jgi:hypothetical protein
MIFSTEIDGPIYGEYGRLNHLISPYLLTQKTRGVHRLAGSSVPCLKRRPYSLFAKVLSTCFLVQSHFRIPLTTTEGGHEGKVKGRPNK